MPGRIHAQKAQDRVDDPAAAGGQQLLVQDDSADAGGKQLSNLQLLFVQFAFLASGAVAGQAGRGGRGCQGQQDSATRDLRGAQVC